VSARLLQGSYLSVMQARTRDDFRQEVVRFADRLGFLFVTAMTVLDRTGSDPDFINVNNVPAGFDATFNDKGQQRLDPVMQHCKRDAVPIVWDQDTYVSRGLADVWEEQAAFGYRTGISLALHLPHGRHFVLGVNRSRALPDKPEALTRLVADLQLFAVHAQDSAFRLLAPPTPAASHPTLTPRELEALRWTMDGKTAWEVGSIMSISERTAVLHLQNAMRKLDCVNKHQAVLKALRIGLLN
jgi:DNA-binding CsgD family transcriptional regulator